MTQTTQRRKAHAKNAKSGRSGKGKDFANVVSLAERVPSRTVDEFADLLGRAKEIEGQQISGAGTSAPAGALPQEGASGASDAPAAVQSIDVWSAGITPTVNSVWRVPMEAMRESQVNPRWAYIESEQEELVASLKAEGQQVPLQAYFDGESDAQHPFVVLDGNGRREAASQLGWSELLVVVVDKPASLTKELQVIREINKNRRQYTLLDEYRAACQLREIHKPKTQKELAQHMGISEGRISEVLTLDGLPRIVLDTLSQCPQAASLRGVRAIRKMLETKDGQPPSDEAVAQTVGLIQLVANGEKSLRNAEMVARKVEKPVTRKRTVKFVEIKDGGKGGMRHYETGRILLDVKDVPQETRAQLWADLQVALAKHCRIHSPDIEFADVSDGSD